MEKTVPMFVSVRTGQTVTTSPASARAGLDLQANNASKVSSNMTSFFSFSGAGNVCSISEFFVEIGS